MPNIDRGIFNLVRGEEMSAAKRMLPMAGPNQQQPLVVDIETHLAGLVRITFECQSYSHGRHTFWHWCGKGAVRLEQPAG